MERTVSSTVGRRRGVSRPARRRELRSRAGLCAIAFALLATVLFAGPTVVPVERRAGEEGPSAIGQGVARVVHQDSGTSLLVLPGEEGGELVLPLPPGVTPVPFGNAVALLPRNDHEPGAPFRIDILSPAGSRTVVRPGATLLSAEPLGRRLVVSYRGKGTGATGRTDVIEEDGSVSWSLTADDPVPPRVAVREDLLAAIHPGRDVSRIDLVAADEDPVARLRFDGCVLTGASFSADGSGLLAWGPREVAWVDLGARAVAWRLRMSRGERPLPSPGFEIVKVAGTVGLPIRREIPGAGWIAGLLLLDARDGSVTQRYDLQRSASMPAGASRLPIPAGERLVFAGRAYDLVDESEDRP